jgi:hypothetical protein
VDKLASLEAVMAKGQKRSNREIKKPKKTPAERAKATAAVTAVATPAMVARGGQKTR